MSYLVLARKYRPQSFDEVAGQDSIARTLQNAIRTDRVAHAYLFAGVRGVGKTTMARILSKALNCAEGPTPEPCNKCQSCRLISTGEDVDVLEIDGASNRKIEEVRNIRANVQYAPAHSKHKIYIIDEVHMLTNEAFNALLKTLEEPPPHVKFIFATTEPHKLPDTILSRCQRFDFHRVSTPDIAERLRFILDKEGVQAEDEAVLKLARLAQGSMRDAQSLLDQLLAYDAKAVRSADVDDVLGLVNEEIVADVVDAARGKNAAKLLQIASDVFASGRDVDNFRQQLLDYLRDLLILKTCEKPDGLVDRSAESIRVLSTRTEWFSLDALMWMIEILTGLRQRIRNTTAYRIELELALLKLMNASEIVAVSDLLERLDAGPSAGRPASGPAPNRSAGVDLSAIGDEPISSTAGRDSASPDAKAPQPAFTLADVTKHWAKLTELVPQADREVRRALVRLAANCEPVALDDGVLSLNFKDNFNHNHFDSPERRRTVEETLTDIFHAPVRIKVVAPEQSRVPSSSKVEPPSEASAPHKSSPGPIVRKAMELFDGRLV